MFKKIGAHRIRAATQRFIPSCYGTPSYPALKMGLEPRRKKRLFPPGFQAHFQGGVRGSPGTGLPRGRLMPSPRAVIKFRMPHPLD